MQASKVLHFDLRLFYLAIFRLPESVLLQNDELVLQELLLVNLCVFLPE